MELALVSGEYPPDQGGVGDYSRELARALDALGVKVRVITNTASRPISSAAPGAGRAFSSEVASTPVRRDAVAPSALVGPAPAAGTAACPIFRAPLRGWRGLPAVHGLARACDLVHVQYQAAAYGMTAPVHALPRYLRLRSAARPVVITFHDLRVPYLFPKAGPMRWRAILFMARACQAVVVTNQADLATLTAEFGKLRAAARPELVMIPIGSNIDAQSAVTADRAATRASLGVAPAELLLCYFGFLNASKGGETLVRVLARVVQAGRPVRLLMLGGEVGASDPTNAGYGGQVRALISELGMDRHVIWAGYRSPAEVSACWAAADIAILPYVDGASLRRGTLMAALAHALPIVTTDPRVPVPQFRDGENIALAPPDDVAALAERVLALADSPALRAQLSRGAALAAAEFAWPRIAERHLELYRSLRVRGG